MIEEVEKITPCNNELIKKMEKEILSMESKGRLFIAILGGADLGNFPLFFIQLN